MTKQLSNSVRLILKPFLFDYMGVIPWGIGTYPPQQRGGSAILVAKVSIYAPYSSRERALLVMWKVQHPKQLVCTWGDFEGVLCIPIS